MKKLGQFYLKIFKLEKEYGYISKGKKIKGVNEKIITDPSKRLADIQTWYIKTKRAWTITKN